MKKIDHIDFSTPDIEKCQMDVIGEVKNLLPGSEVEAIGAVAVPMAGRREVDVMVLSNNVVSDTEILAQNGYKKGPIENEISYLKIVREGVEIGVQIVPVGHKMIDIHRQIISMLRSDENLRKRYEQFKLLLDGLSREEYKQKKSAWIKENLLL